MKSKQTAVLGLNEAPSSEPSAMNSMAKNYRVWLTLQFFARVQTFQGRCNLLISFILISYLISGGTASSSSESPIEVSLPLPSLLFFSETS